MDPDMALVLSLALVAVTLLLLIVTAHYRGRVRKLEASLDDARTRKKSLATTYGRITEQFAPFMAAYPFEARNFRFIGSPVDGVQFEADGIHFIEFKAAGGRVTPDQARIRRLVEDGRVYWHVFHAREGPAPARGEDAGVLAREG